MSARVLGNYRVVRQLGEGGMATAWLATAPDGRPVVLKIPLEPTPSMTVRLRDEAQAGRRVHHHHVVSTLDFFVDNGRPVLVIEYVDGCALRDLRSRDGMRNPLPPVVVAWLGRAVADALVAIHEAKDDHGRLLGMLHRDVTASNILIGRDGVPKLIDLGIARSAENESEATQVGTLKGTLRYLAPELLLGEGYTPSTDLWALGVSLFEAALGRRMVSGEPVDIFRSLTTGNFRDLRRGEYLDPHLQDALFALLAEKSQRLRNARAASRMFGAVEARLGNTLSFDVGGDAQAILASLVPFAQDVADDDGAPSKHEQSGPAPRHPRDTHGTRDTGDFDVATVAGVARSPHSTTPGSPPASPSPPSSSSASSTMSSRVVIGGTEFGMAATLQMPAVQIGPASPAVDVRPTGAGPTLILPRVDVSPSLSRPEIGPTAILPAFDMAPAPKRRRPVTADSSPGEGVVTTETAGVRRPAPGDVLPVGAPTIVMPTWVPEPQPEPEWEDATDKTPRASEAKPTLVMPAANIRPNDD